MQKKKHPGKPRGATYADVLARQQMIKAAVLQAAKDDTVALQSDIRTQRMTWLMVCSIADAYGFGPVRMQPFFKAFQDNADEYEKMLQEVDAEYANEKLRQRAEQVSGIEIQYLYEAEIRAAKRKNLAAGIVMEDTR